MTIDPRPQAPSAGHLRPRPPRWLHSDYLVLGALPGAVPSARLHARRILAEWGLPDGLASDAEQVLCELVTNAVEVTRDSGLLSPVRLTLLADQRSVMVAVWDGSPKPPRPRDFVPGRAGFLEEGGRGLRVVAALAAAWDCVPVLQEQGGGKVVRALLCDGAGQGGRRR